MATTGYEGNSWSDDSTEIDPEPFIELSLLPHFFIAEGGLSGHV